MLPDRLAAFIAANGIAAEVVETAAAAPTAEDAARLLGVHVSDIVKTMVLSDGMRAVAAIVAGDARLDRKKVARTVGLASLRFATAAEVLEHTGYPPGGVAPFAFAAPVTVVVDAVLTLSADRVVVAGGGRAELLLRVAVADLVRHNQAIVAPIGQDPK
jgi:Cys-tRNA(Pro) deacylase